MPNEIYSKWDTPASDARSLALVSLVDQQSLEIVLQDLKDSSRRRYKCTFRRAIAYRSTLEGYFGRPTNRKNLGWTQKVTNSTWLNQFHAQQPHTEATDPDCEHYIIITEDEVIEVLSSTEPSIIEVESAKEADKQPGKSKVYYDPDDRPQIDQILRDFRRNAG